MKRVVSFALAIMMVLTSVLIGGTEVKAAELTPEEVALTNADFANGKTDWNCVENSETSSWIYGYKYADNSWLNKPENADDDCLKFESVGESEITLSQTIVKLPKGLYEVAIPVMGEKASVTVKLGNQTSAVTYLDEVSGWNQWATVSATFNVEETVENAVLSVSVYCWSGAYGYIDRVDLEGSNNDGYKVALSADTTSVEKGGTVNLTATATYNGQNVTLGDDYKLWFWEEDGAGDAWCSNTTGTVLENVVTLPSTGTYKINAELKNAANERVAIATVELTATEPVVNDIYTVEVTADQDSAAVDGTITLTAVVKKNGETLTDLGDLKLWFWPDTWKEGHDDGLNNEEATNIVINGNSGATLTETVTLKSVGKYYVMAELKDASGTWLAEDCITLTATASSSAGGQGTGSEQQPETENKEESKEEEKVVVFDVPLQNGTFTEEITDEGAWKGETKSGGWQEVGNKYEVIAYSEDAWLEKPAGAGSNCLKFDVNTGDELTIYQWVKDLKAGTYSFSMPVMGEHIDVYFVIGDKTVKATSLEGWNNWKTAKATITLTEDVASEKVGFKLVATGGKDENWGFIDSITVKGGVPSTGDTSNIYAYVMLMMAGVALVGYTVKRNKVEF